MPKKNGSWRLVVLTDLDLIPLALIRTPDGFLTTVHETIAGDGLSPWKWSNWLLAVLIVGSATLLAAPNANTVVSRAMVTLGNASYSLYLTHVIVLAMLAAVWKKVGAFDTVGLLAFLAIGVASTLAAGLLSYRLLELPMTNALKSLRPRRSRLAVV